jgi:hypothetical protein
MAAGAVGGFKMSVLTVELDPLLTCLLDVLGRRKIELVLAGLVTVGALFVALAFDAGWEGVRPVPVL